MHSILLCAGFALSVIKYATINRKRSFHLLCVFCEVAQEFVRHKLIISDHIVYLSRDSYPYFAIELIENREAIISLQHLMSNGNCSGDTAARNLHIRHVANASLILSEQSGLPYLRDALGRCEDEGVIVAADLIGTEGVRVLEGFGDAEVGGVVSSSSPEELF